MMSERNKKLVQDYGPRTFERMSRMLDDCLHLSADALSVMTDEEWKACGEAMVQLKNELWKVRLLVYERMIEAGVEPR